MRLYLVQHAEAKPEEEDPARPLSDKGWRDIRRVAEFLRGKGVRVDRILHSGKLRARQTAEVLAEELSVKKLEQTDGLAPLDDPKVWADRLEGEEGSLMLVGHLPHLSKLSSLLLLHEPERRIVGFKQAGVVCLERDESGKWFVLWALVPELI